MAIPNRQSSSNIKFKDRAALVTPDKVPHCLFLFYGNGSCFQCCDRCLLRAMLPCCIGIDAKHHQLPLRLRYLHGLTLPRGWYAVCCAHQGHNMPSNCSNNPPKLPKSLHWTGQGDAAVAAIKKLSKEYLKYLSRADLKIPFNGDGEWLPCPLNSCGMVPVTTIGPSLLRSLIPPYRKLADTCSTE